jgi:MFS family permease
MSKRLPHSIILLGLLSFFNDMAGDMVKPLLPAFIASLGLGAGFLGLLEGIANSASYTVMLLSGSLADRLGKSRFFTILGYCMSSIARPILAIPWPGATLFSRFFDRVGKGLRTAPRDQLITSFSEQQNWGRSFGFQRAMDHAGGLVGTALATFLILKLNLSFSSLVLIFSLPVLILVLLLAPKISLPQKQFKPPELKLRWKGLPKALKVYTLIIFVSSLGTPSELFLILKMQEQGLSSAYSPLAWFVMASFTLIAAYVGGPLGDLWSRRNVIILGWLLFVITFLLIASNENLMFSWFLVALFGLQNGLVEAAERAYCSEVAPPRFRATAFGWYYFAYGAGALPASLLFGLLWKDFGSSFPFFLSAAISFLALALLLISKKYFPRQIVTD